MLDITSITLNAHFIYHSLYHASPTHFGVSHTIFRENLRVPYPKTPAFVQLLSVVLWYSVVKDTTLLIYNNDEEWNTPK
jgi:hypothetical protein